MYCLFCYALHCMKGRCGVWFKGGGGGSISSVLYASGVFIQLMQIPPADVVVRWAKNVDSEGRRGHRGQQAHADFAHRRVCNDDQRHPVCIQAQRFKEDLQVTRNTMTVIVLLVASVRSNNSRMGGGLGRWAMYAIYCSAWTRSCG